MTVKGKDVRFLLLVLLAGFSSLPMAAREKRIVGKLWGSIDYDGAPWVENVSKPVKFKKGLYDRHLTVWASHGRYYDNKKGVWKWQRPNLFCTTEDLFTQTIVYPYLLPMLENAGAVVFTPRERDWQTEEYIVDPDGGLNSTADDYKEYSEMGPWQSTGRPGFAARGGSYVDGQNPFTDGRCRMLEASKKADKAFVKYQPTFRKAGRYAVYVSYQTVPGSVDDAHYTVFHRGQATELRVNQQMGGGTWVYLGTFDFDAGNNIYNCVMLTNQSRRRGVVTADAVRFGGGMGNIERGGVTSGLPRSLEGARYWAQWAGAPYTVYGGRGGQDDYADDINTRSKMLNWLAGGSDYVPTRDGLGVPMELSLAIHSDAGYHPNGKDIWGSLAICTTNFNNGQLASGVTRQASKKLASALLDNVTADLQKEYGRWAKRYLWDRNYSESRLPEVPSAILETVSHQSFPDMLMAQDPNFRFSLARSVYKTLLRYVCQMHGEKAVVAPLAPQGLRVEIVGKDQVRVSWRPQVDKLEESAEPDAYILYTASGHTDFDNGEKVKGTSKKLKIAPGVQYNFRVTAVNKGGESFPSEVVSVYLQPGAARTVLVVNGFNRLSAPEVVDDVAQQGFLLQEDAGVSDGLMAGWAGEQECFDRSRMGREGPGGLGYGGNEMAGHFIMGNTFDYAETHVAAIAAARRYNVVTASADAVEQGYVRMTDYAAVDLYTGLNRMMPYSLKYYKAFTPTLQRLLRAYTLAGGRLLVSGAYVGSDMLSDDGKRFLSEVCHASFDGQLRSDAFTSVTGLGQTFDFYRTLNPDHYAATHVDALSPVGTAICPMVYGDGMGAAVAYSGRDCRTFTMAFPFECITSETVRNTLMAGILNYLLE